MKKLLIIFLLSLIFTITSCKMDTDIDEILNKNVIKNQFLLWDTGTSVIELNNERFIDFDRLDISRFLFSDENGVYLIEDNLRTIYYYNYETKEFIEYARSPYDIYWSTYDNKLIGRESGDSNTKKYYLLSFDTFEILETIDEKSIEEYRFGLSNFYDSASKTSYIFNGEEKNITIDDILSNNNLDLKINKRRLYLSHFYRYKDEFYISIDYGYKRLSNELLVFKIEDDGYRFINYCHYSVDCVYFTKYCGPQI